MSQHTREAFRIERDGHVATVELLGPGKGNALGMACWDELPGVFEELDADDEVRAVVLRGSGEHFSYGLDLKDAAPMFMELIQEAGSARARQKLHEKVLEWQAGVDAIERCRKPVIAAIHGWCIGGGINLISACDTRIASAGARLSLREVKLAIVPDLGALQRLPALIGQGMTRRLAFTGEDVSAARALEIGLVDEVCDDDEACFAQARQVAAQIAANSPLTVQGIKQVLNHGLDHQRAAGRAYVAAWNAAFLPSEDLMQAFMDMMNRE